MTHIADNHLVRRITAPRPVVARHPPAGLCELCESDATAVADCRPHDDETWLVQLRCGDCGTWRELVVSELMIGRVEHAVMAGWQAIERDLLGLERERMAAEIETFAIALERDLIDADDFALSHPAAQGR